MAVKEPWNIYQGYSINCNCENSTSDLTKNDYLNSIDNWSTVPGNSVEYSYDGGGNVTTAVYKKDGVTIFTITYAYDGGGNVTSITTS